MFIQRRKKLEIFFPFSLNFFPGSFFQNTLHNIQFQMSVTPRFEKSPKYIFACDIRNGEMNIISCSLESAEKIEEAINYSEMIERYVK